MDTLVRQRQVTGDTCDIFCNKRLVLRRLAVGNEARFFGPVTPQAAMLERLLRAQTQVGAQQSLQNTLKMYTMHPYIQFGDGTMQTISATNLARNTREILDKVASRGETVVIERNHTMIAQIMPPPQTMTASQALAGLTLPMLTPAQAAAWLKDSKGNFGDVVRDPWA